MLLRKVGLKTKGLDATAPDRALEDERKTFTRDGKQEHGFTSSIVPTMEEKLITEQMRNPEFAKQVQASGKQATHKDDSKPSQNDRVKHGSQDLRTKPSGANAAVDQDDAKADTECNKHDEGAKHDQSQGDSTAVPNGDAQHGQDNDSGRNTKKEQQKANDAKHSLANGDAKHGHTNGDADHGSDSEAKQSTLADSEASAPEARAEGELYGVPANADVENDNKMPGTKADSDSEDEERALDARSVARKNLNAKIGTKQWTLPTPTPNVDPYGFEDPICDSFWKNTWLACAVHNVSIFPQLSVIES
jgi:phospholipase D1/2